MVTVVVAADRALLDRSSREAAPSSCRWAGHTVGVPSEAALSSAPPSRRHELVMYCSGLAVYRFGLEVYCSRFGKSRSGFEEACGGNCSGVLWLKTLTHWLSERTSENGDSRDCTIQQQSCVIFKIFKTFNILRRVTYGGADGFVEDRYR